MWKLLVTGDSKNEKISINEIDIDKNEIFLPSLHLAASPCQPRSKHSAVVHRSNYNLQIFFSGTD